MTSMEDLKFIRIEKDFRVNILENQEVKSHLEDLLDGAEENIRNKINKIILFLNLSSYNRPGSELSVDNLSNLFNKYFCQSIVIEAISIALAVPENTDILSNIKGLLNYSTLSSAINGDVMVFVFKKAIDKERIINRSKKIELLEQKFSHKTKHNHCIECGCKCECNAECKGDIRRCTSKESLARRCTHCCHCYLREMIINL